MIICLIITQIRVITVNFIFLFHGYGRRLYDASCSNSRVYSSSFIAVLKIQALQSECLNEKSQVLQKRFELLQNTKSKSFFFFFSRAFVLLSQWCPPSEVCQTAGVTRLPVRSQNLLLTVNTSYTLWVLFFFFFFFFKTTLTHTNTRKNNMQIRTRLWSGSTGTLSRVWI